MDTACCHRENNPAHRRQVNATGREDQFRQSPPSPASAGRRNQVSPHSALTTDVVVSRQRPIGNRATSGHIKMRRVQRFGENEHKAIGDRAKGDVQFRLAPMVNMGFR
jgi:hypothetical protein